MSGIRRRTGAFKGAAQQGAADGAEDGVRDPDEVLGVGGLDEVPLPRVAAAEVHPDLDLHGNGVHERGEPGDDPSSTPPVHQPCMTAP